MKALFLSIVVLTGCASLPPVDGSVTVTVPAEKVAQCKAQGGCGLFSPRQILELMQQAYDLGVVAGGKEGI